MKIGTKKLDLLQSFQDYANTQKPGFVHPVTADVTTFWGDQMTVVLPEEVSFFIAVNRYYEKGLTHMLIECLDEGMVFFDIGAHFGYFTLLASNIVGPGGQVHSFEPTKSTFEFLTLNAAGRSNVTLNNKAVYSSTTELSFRNFGIDQCAYNSLFPPRVRTEDSETMKPETEIVQAITVDEYVESTGIVPNFVKVDAESAEFQILEGMRRTLIKHRPILTVEVGDNDIEGVRPSRDLVKYAVSFGYRVVSSTNGALVSHFVQQRYAYDNLLFLPERI